MSHDLASIRTRVQARLVDITPTITTEVDELINAAIRKGEEFYNFRIMEASTELVTTLATRRLPAASTSMPSNWKESRAKPYLREGQGGVLGTRAIQWAPTLEEMVLLYSLDDPNDKGQPQFVLEDFPADEFSVFPFPDGASQWTDGEYRVTIPYWRFLPDLVNDGDTNWFTHNMTEYIQDMATADGFMLNWDEERAGIWLRKSQISFDRGKKFDKRAKLPRSLTLNLKRAVFAPSHTRRS